MLERTKPCELDEKCIVSGSARTVHVGNSGGLDDTGASLYSLLVGSISHIVSVVPWEKKFYQFSQ